MAENQDFDTSIDKKENAVQNDKSRSCIRWRFITMVMAFLGMFTSYTMRNNISVAIVSMVNGTSGDDTYDVCDNTTHASPTQIGEFGWDSQTQGIILSSFYWGYIVPQILAGGLADKYGAKLVMLVGGGVATLMTLLAPIAARTNLGFLIATRVICGFGFAVYCPCFHALISNWVNADERSKATSFVYAGCQFGTAVTMALSGILCEYAPDGGWPWSFYTFGILGAVWLVLWCGLVFSTPRENPWISEEEILFIEGTIPKPKKGNKPPVPWKAIATSVPIWAIIISGFGSDWGLYTLMTELPSYMSQCLGFNLSANGLYSSLPYILNAVYSVVIGVIADYMIANKVLKRKNVRKLFGVMAMCAPGILLLIITFLKCQVMTIYALLVLAVVLGGTDTSGGVPNIIDVAPTFAATIQGIMNTFSTIPGIVSPYISGVITNGKENQQSWNVVFYIGFGILMVFGILFGLLCQADILPWNYVKEKTHNESELHVEECIIEEMENKIA